jgi:tRNA pseudouridine32 synthase/23S rRNA pseudouridine746 synthase
MKFIKPTRSIRIKQPIVLKKWLEEVLPFDESHLALLCDYGAVWLTPSGKKNKHRIREINTSLNRDDVIEVYVDEKILSIKPCSQLQWVKKEKSWGVCLKPAGVLSQGTFFGDQNSMMYALEKDHLTPFLIHRLDRETEGLMVFAWTPQAAKDLSSLWQDRSVVKKYQGIVVGNLSQHDLAGEIKTPLDDKEALTKYKVLKIGNYNRALVEFDLITGRLHQIRRHLLSLECSLWGDPKYGINNKNQEGMKLAHTELKFKYLKVDYHFKYEAPHFLNYL